MHWRLLSIYSTEDCTLVLKVPPYEVKNCVNFLKKSFLYRCNTLLDIWGVDYPEEVNRFEVNYLLLSLKRNLRIVVRTEVGSEGSVGLESVCEIFFGANWLEREVWDMFGVYFGGHPDLRRILTDYGFEGHPLRKDFPLSGFVEVRYEDGIKSIVIEPIELMQEYREFDCLEQW